MMKKLLQLFLIFVAILSNAEEFRIVSLSPAMTEIICHLGLRENLVGRSEVCNYPESVKNLPIAGAFAKPNVEKILRLKPTHIVTNDLINPGVIAINEQQKIEVLMMQCNSLLDYEKCVEKISQLFNKQALAEKEIAKIADFKKNRYKPLNIKVLWIIFDAPLMVAGANSLPDEILQLAGVANIAENIGQPYFKCSLDWVIKQNPDVVIYSGSPNGWRKPIWQKIPAVKKGKIIYDLNEDITLRMAPRIFEGIAELRSKLEELQ
ncbi:MAG: ABC transporter substrate-binding protein [Lentisphaeria bacterium]|nr:ABC transporter substrate-binding protein [Lentisphaeria bacterium]